MTERVLIVGLGLIGGSIGAALRGCGEHVTGYDSSLESSAKALELNLVDDVTPVLTTAASEATMVILAVPVMAIIDLLPIVDAAAPPSTLIVDTGSVKLPIVERMARLPGAGRAIGGHPLAGAETSGPEAADPRLMDGRIFVLSPSTRTDASSVQRARSLIENQLHMKATMLPAEQHDRILARTSHLPQFVSTVLALCLSAGDEELSGPSLDTMTRLAASDPTMWRDIAASNRGNIVEAMRLFRQQFDVVMDMMQSGDLTGIEETMRRGAIAARRIDLEDAIGQVEFR